ncbi:TPA: hypothetical protein DDW35_02485, partial [Candidatus Sumerlaeota bacterium]|nr:hypothetical protein [Candidatus Sumerlaeota bacterium]
MIFPEYSVIIPTWNRASTVLTAIGSALNQTHPPLEVLVCDDASTDNTEELVRSLGDPRVIWLSGPRGGRPAIPRNRGIRVARGEWVAFLDSDDAWLPEKMEKQFTLAQALHCQAACTNAVKIVPKQPDFHETLLPWNSGERITLADQIATNNVITSSVALQRDLLLRAGGGFPEDAQLKVGE